MKRLLSTALLACLLFSMFTLLSEVHAATTVNGVIASDTTWRASSSPITLSGPLSVAQGVTLTIEPGVTVKANYEIKIDGTLNVRGNDLDKITFKLDAGSVAAISFSSTAGGIIENAVFDRLMISIDGCSPTITGNIFNSPSSQGVFASGGSSTISNNIFYLFDNSHQAAIVASDRQTITGNKVYAEGWQYGIQAGGNTYLSGNMVDGAWTGIKASGSCTIDANTLINNHDAGVDATDSSAKIINNYIENNRQHGVIGGAEIQGNTIINNSVGIFNPLSSTKISNNNILNNNIGNLIVDGSFSIVATNNWWGTTNTQEIKQTIKDNSNSSFAQVTFIPCLNQPSASAPSSTIVTSSSSNSNPAIAFFDSIFNYEIENGIITTAQIVLAAFGVFWLLLLIVFVVKRMRRYRLVANY